MNSSKYFLIVLGLFCFSVASFAQNTEDPASWQFEIKKKSAKEYQLIFHLELAKGWHIWSLHPGGDGYEIAPTFTFRKNPHVKLKGKIAEKGAPTTTKMEGIDGKVTYLSGKVDYTQEITVTGTTQIMGKFTYQVCNDRMCLPPKEKEFKFETE